MNSTGYHAAAIDCVNKSRLFQKPDDANLLTLNGYFAVLQQGKFVTLGKLDDNGTEDDKGNGWKFHISSHMDDHEKTVDIVAKHAISNGLTMKFAIGDTLNNMHDAEYKRKGRAITLYSDDMVDMQLVLSDIEKDLHIANIKAGHNPNVDKKITGSSYISYRNDLNEHGKYFDALSVAQNKNAYNLSGKPDPLAGFKMPQYLDGKTLIAGVNTIQTNKGIYLPVDGLTEDNNQALQLALTLNGIGFEEKKTSLNGGMNVLSVTFNDAGKLLGIQVSKREELKNYFNAVNVDESAVVNSQHLASLRFMMTNGVRLE